MIYLPYSNLICYYLQWYEIYMTYANEFMNSVSRGTIFKKIIYLLLTGFLSTKLLQRRPQLSLLFMYRKVLSKKLRCDWDGVEFDRVDIVWQLYRLSKPQL